MDSKLRLSEWQDGYGGFTVSKSQIPDVVEYIKNQRTHHRKKTFQEEYLELLPALKGRPKFRRR
jgi:putative transposase